MFREKNLPVSRLIWVNSEHVLPLKLLSLNYRHHMVGITGFFGDSGAPKVPKYKIKGFAEQDELGGSKVCDEKLGPCCLF